MHHQPSSAGAPAMCAYSAAFMYSSAIALPLPLDRPAKTPSSSRPQRREQQQQPQPASAASAGRLLPPPKKKKHQYSHSRSSSGSQSRASNSSRSSQETALLSSPSALLHHWNGPAAAATSPMTAAAAADVGHDDSHSQLFKASSLIATTTTTYTTTYTTTNNTTNNTTTTTSSSLSLNPLSPSAASRPAKAFPRMHRVRPATDALFSSIDLRNASSSQAADHHDSSNSSKSAAVRQMSGLTTRAESISSTSGTASLSARTMTSTDPSSAGDNHFLTRPFVQRNGRTYLNDTSLPYPLPSDLTELHRQTLRTLLLIQVFGAPVCSPSLTKKPPQRVLEIGCGSGFWSMMCHKYFVERGHRGISFTGIDLAPLAADGSGNGTAEAMKPDAEMNWNFVQHDLRHLPWPLPNEEYDLIMVKDMSLATTNMQNQLFIDEYIRLLRPGGTLEIWESDHLIRMLRPHIPGATVSTEDADEQLAASNLGAYVMNANTPLSPPINTYLGDYNHWLSRALESRDLSPVPCTLIGPVLLQESEILTDVKSRRLAIPLSEVRWEREGVGGIITKPHTESKGKESPTPRVEQKMLTAPQMALRQTALLTVVQQVQALEPILREVSGKSQDEWDGWLSKMMGDLMSESGTSWGECLEVGAWCAKKKKATS